MSDNYNLIVSFTDESPSFVHGFEAGQIWQDMNNNRPIDLTVHAENREIIERMAVASGYEAVFMNTELKEWLYLRAEKRRPRPESGNPNGLRIVK